MSSSFGQSGAAAAARHFGADLDNDGLDGDYSMIAEYPDEADYYSLLGLSSQPPPSEAEIRSAYRNLTLSFHPDKQPPHLRDAAQRHFTRIQEAYDTLIDPKKRAVYDILGAEGVRQEWGTLGAMGRGGEAQRQQVGVKLMSPDEFRRWFLKTMKNRERKAVESLVSSRGVLTLGINASSTISVNEEDGDVKFHVPSPQLSTLGASYSFKTPLPFPEFHREQEEESKDEEQEQNDRVKDLGDEDEPVQVAIKTGIVGIISHRKQKGIATYEDDTTKEIEIPLPPILVSQQLTLGATVTPNFRAMAGTKGIWNRQPLSFLRDSTVILDALLLPTPTFKTTVARSIQPIAGIRPFQVTGSSIVKRSLLETPPAFEVQVTKEVAQRKVAFMSWSSGVLGWPDMLLRRFSFLGMGIEDAYAASSDHSTLQVGLVALPKTPQNVIEIDEDNEAEKETEIHQMRQTQKEIDRAAESWQTFFTVTPAGGGIGLTYSRNLFSGKPADDPVRSEWSAEGYLPMGRMEEARAVRLEVTTLLDTSMSISWNVKGTRRVGEYTKVGLGVGLSGHGVVMTISWNRLGQVINLPVVLCSATEASHDAAALATIFPWLAYCAVEFGYIRPRNRRQRRQAAARRHKELKRLIPKKREESEQAIELMFDQVQRQQAREEAQDGLVIRKAEYGYVRPEGKKAKNGFTEARVIDVTVPIAALVERSRLVIPQNTVKFQIIGFHDPAPLLPKRLKIWYTFQGRDHFVEVGDKEGVACPMRTHLISD